MLRPIKRTNIAEEIAEQLLLMILRSEICPGDRLPSEAELMEQLGVGRSSVREAIRSLSIMGLVDVRQGDGVFVRNDSGFFAKAMTQHALMSSKTREQLMEVREIVETGIAPLAALRATDQDIAALRRAVLAMREHLCDIEAFLDLDLTFHLTLADMTNNAMLYEMLLTIRGLMKQFIHDNLAQPGSPAAALREHEQILCAIEQRDPGMAREAILAHLRGLASRHPVAQIVSSN